MAHLETPTQLREHALALAAELGVDQGTWYVRVLEEGRREGLEPDLGALVRAYWELLGRHATGIVALSGCLSGRVRTSRRRS